MKRLVSIFLMALLLCGCASSAGDTVPEAEPAEAAAIAETAETAAADARTESSRTEEELQAIFLEHAREGAEILDIVLMEETVCDIAGVVQYTLGTPGTCRFDFIKADGSICRMGMEFLLDGENTLACAGEDRISCRMLRENGEPYLCTIFYYEDAVSGEKGFKVSES